MANSSTGSCVPDAQQDYFLTTAEVADRYRTSESTVRYWRHAGIGPRGIKIGTKVLYRESELARWEREREAEQNGAA
ncbi:AlpA family transcriptional regulator [Microbispora sp. GKU 823]|uniref:helix-turn-helix transcriptional regulator n=1 Tax=Microbispora sp. GKU 823 TaxID=1652100 RepID=UPI0009A393F8|nr:helix-turn-helix domain-containing protein [Microbispora sp. GKU 823]OPG04141.1 DNA-binding protein [Microbispora sp. GKU 823]